MEVKYRVEVDGEGPAHFSNYDNAKVYALYCENAGCIGRIAGPDVDEFFGVVLNPYAVKADGESQTTQRTVSRNGETGRKDDAGKPRFCLVPPAALLEIAKALTAGPRWRLYTMTSALVDRVSVLYHRHVNR